MIRRATFDLIGLPPTPEEVDAFLADEAPDAFARLVDRLLASPRYGERWGRHWLDIARYADSNGLDENLCYARAWRYRDYVIESFNQDKPYDQFVQEQLAGDLLPKTGNEKADNARLIATGFLSLGPKMLAEDDPVKMRMDIIDEQVDTVGRAFMGMTLGCARCHDHKFDPISTKEYYALAGIFHSTKTMENHRVVATWHEYTLASEEDQKKLAAQEKRIEAKKRQIAGKKRAATNALQSDARGRLADYLLAGMALREQRALRARLQPILAMPNGNKTPGLQIIEAENYARGNASKVFDGYGEGIGVIINGGKFPNVAEYDVSVEKPGPYQIELRYAANESRPVNLIINGRMAKADAGGETTGSWNPDTQTWFVEGIFTLKGGKNTIRLERKSYFPHFDKLIVFPSKLPAGSTPKTAAQIAAERGLSAIFVQQWADYLTTTEKDASSILAEFHRAQPAAREVLARQIADRAKSGDESLAKLLRSREGPFRRPENAENYFTEATRAQLAGLDKELKALEKAKPDFPRAMGVREGEIGNIRVHLRGSHLTLGEEAPRRFPAALGPNEQTPMGQKASGRLALAKWLTQPDHPLTARVMVNRIWRGHFGEGLVRSVDNFGTLGEQPDNQPLLDWLALRFLEKGWSVKAMHRLIMLSNTYQMSARYNAKAAQIDPRNRLLWRYSRRRLEAEAIRDAVLAVSGDLDFTMGGTLLKFRNRQYVTSTANRDTTDYDTPRRSVYLPVVRSSLYNVFQAFDFADPSSLNGARATTTIAPQALFMMNSSLVLKQTRSWAEKLLAQEGMDDAGRITLAYRTAFGRSPSQAEIERSVKLMAKVDAQLAKGEMKAEERRLRTWQSLCRVLMATNEFIFVD